MNVLLIFLITVLFALSIHKHFVIISNIFDIINLMSYWSKLLNDIYDELNESPKPLFKLNKKNIHCKNVSINYYINTFMAFTFILPFFSLFFIKFSILKYTFIFLINLMSLLISYINKLLLINNINKEINNKFNSKKYQEFMNFLSQHEEDITKLNILYNLKEIEDFSYLYKVNKFNSNLLDPSIINSKISDYINYYETFELANSYNLKIKYNSFIKTNKLVNHKISI